jgi:adenylate cyclase
MPDSPGAKPAIGTRSVNGASGDGTGHKRSPRAAASGVANPTRRGAGRAEDDLPKALYRAELLLEVSRAAAGFETLTEVLEKVVSIAAKETRAERGTVFLNDPERGELYSRVVAGGPVREIRILNDSGIAGLVFQSGEGVIIHNPYSDPRFNDAVDSQTGYVTRNVVCAPVRTMAGEVIGVVQALNKTKGKFTQEDLSLLEAMATQAAVALQSMQQVERMRRSHLQEMEFLNLVSEMTGEITLDKLLAKVMAEATRMLKADRSTLFLNDERTTELFSRIALGEGVGEIRLPNHAGIAGAVFTSGQAVNIPHAYADLRFSPSFDKQTGYFTRSILCVPVTNKSGKVIGVTQVLNKRGGPFTGEDEQRLKAFTAQVALALENAKLFDDVQNMKNYDEGMLESMSNAVITLDADGKVVTCNAAGLRIMAVTSTEIIGKAAKDYFVDDNAWVMDKVQSVQETQRSEVMMDRPLLVKGEKHSVNATVLPLISVEGKALGTLIMLEDISSEKRMKSTMARYMDPDLADQLMAGGIDLLGGLETTATVLFSDIRGFTTLTEALGAQGTVALLNEYFTLMVECITAQGGMVDKYIGDAIMAAFGVPVEHDDDEDRAVRAAITMLTSLDEWNKQRTFKGQLPVNIGIGLNTDLIVSGNIGSPTRMNYTLIGDGVNLASRLESACKQYKANLLISEYTFKRLKGTYRLRDVDDVIVIGKTEPVRVYEVLDHYSDFPNLMEVVGHFKEGRQHFTAGAWDRAIASFRQALAANPHDKLSEIYLERCELMKANPPDEWDGVWRLESK